MNNLSLSNGAGLAGTALIAMSLLDLLLGTDSPGPVHAVVGSFGLVLLAISAAANAG